MNVPFVGYMYDMAQGTYPKPGTVEKALRLAAESGFTHFIPYLENMIRLPSIEKACPKSAFTPKDWRRFEKVAAEAGIELVPCFATIGHQFKICAVYPELSGPAVEQGRRELDPTTPVARDWTIRCIDEFCGFSSSRYFVVNGDEWQTPNHLLARTDLKVGELWANQINLAAERLKFHGRTPIAWHDMLIHYPEAMSILSRDVMIGVWHYDVDSDYPILEMLKQRGFRVIMASGLAGNCTFPHRRYRAMLCAMKAIDRYDADGFLMTSWHDCRWEKQSLNIPLVGRVLKGRTPPEAILRAISLENMFVRVDPDHPLTARITAELAALLKDPAWNEFSAYRDYLAARCSKDVEKEKAMFLRAQTEESSVYQRLCQPPPPAAAAAGAEPPAVAFPKSFDLQTAEEAAEGPVLRFLNGDETFVVYPKYGAVLQDWRVSGHQIIRHDMPAFVKSCQHLPGGYRSYGGLDGFRPAWVLGMQHQPCITWNYPWEWRVMEKTADQIAVEVRRSFEHVDLAYVIRVDRGQPGFRMTVRGQNRPPHVYAGFNWNLPLRFSGSDLDRISFHWKEGGQEKTTSLADKMESGFWIEATDALAVRMPHWTLELTTEPAHTAGYIVDWTAVDPYSYVTPDVHSVYRKMSAGDTEETSWRFAVSA